MLVFHEERLVPTDVNVLVFAGKNDTGYFYVHRSLYDQAVIISDKYGDDIQQLYALLGGGDEMRDDVSYFMSVTPEPLRSLGPFLLLVKENIDNFIDMVGAIHVMSTQFDLRKMLTVPESLRVTLMFNLRITEEYQLSWDRFIASSMPYTKPVLLPPYVQQRDDSPTATSTEDTAKESEDDFVPDEEDAELAELMAIFGAPADQIEAVRRGEAELIDTSEKYATNSTAEVAVAPENTSGTLESSNEITAEESVVEEEIENKPLTGLDLVRSFIH